MARHFTKLASVAQFILLATILNVKVANVCASITPELTNADGPPGTVSNSDALVSGFDEKRSWNSLQGSWGKRNTQAATATVDDVDNWIPIMISNGEHFSTAANPSQLRDSSVVYLVNAATLERLVRERQADSDNYLESNEDAELGDDSDSGNGILNEKRAWKNLNAAWGKRRNAPSWNKFSGAWGKREPSWNNLKGMWGKRASNWQKLHGGWGKRSALGLTELNN